MEKRIILLSESEIKDIWDYPIFTHSDQRHYFYLTEDIQHALNKFKKIEAKIYLLLQWSYFSYRQIIYPISFKKSANDISYLVEQFFPAAVMPINLPSYNIQKKIRKVVCKLFSIDQKLNVQQTLKEKASALIKYNCEPRYLLRELFLYMDNHRIPLPAYTTLQTLIGNVIMAEEKRLSAIIKQNTPKTIQKIMDNLLVINTGLSSLSSLKMDPKNFKTHQIQKELKKQLENKSLFIFSKKFLPKLDISNKNIIYYGSLAMYYDANKLSQFVREKFYLYMLCFIYSQFHKINNNLIDGFLHIVSSYDKNSLMDVKKEREKSTLTADRQKTASKILVLFEGTKKDNSIFKKIKQGVFKRITSPKELKEIRILLGGAISKLEYMWKYHYKNHMAVTVNLRPLFMALDFEYLYPDTDLKKSADFIRAVFKDKNSLGDYTFDKFPQGIIPKKLKKIFTKFKEPSKGKKIKTIEPYHYEYLVYQKLAEGFNSGHVLIENSVEYKSLNSDLNLGKNWKKTKNEIIENSHVPELENKIHNTLKEFNRFYNELLEHVNTRIRNGENKDIKIKKDKKTGEIKWTLPYKKAEDEVDNTIYDEVPQINIIDLLSSVNELCNFMEAFQHIKPHRSQKFKNYPYILACIIANATNLGTYKMAESSKLSYDILANLEKSHVTLENLCEANKIIVNETSKLPMFKHYNILDDVFHGSTDGQKYDTDLQTFISRFLRKYFKEKGVSAYTLSVNHVPVKTKIITGHESHYLYDTLSNNTTDIQPDIVSTDTEGHNQVNYAFLRLKNIFYAPCYKTITSKAKLIGKFKNTKYKEDDIIKPSEIFNEPGIIEQWKNIQKIFIATLSGEVSQSTIVKKLSSHKRKNKTKEALWEYNNILMSIYLLCYIDDPVLRRCVRVSLNRGESYHQLRRSVSNVGGRAFRGKSEMEILIWNECSRLVCNAIIYYNTYMYSKILELKIQKNDQKAIKLLKKKSPATWGHINFLGMYDFSKIGVIDTEEMLSIMMRQFDLELSKMNEKNKEPEIV